MDYDASKGEWASVGLKRDPFKSIVAPRPVGWISTVSASGIVNLAPYSFFAAISEDPHFVMFSSGGIKDSLKNIMETGEFTCSIATYDLRDAVNITSASVPYGVDEFPIAGLTAAPSRFVKPPRVKESPAALECRHFQTVVLPRGAKGLNYHVVIGEVIGIHINESIVKNGRVATADLLPIARLGGPDYGVIRPETAFALGRPAVGPDGRVGIKDRPE
jgi:flavin reductase (DIM6/NTAB) family NADH-FMN oxidoreductase RutF